MVSVPLNLDANPHAEEWDIQGALAEAMKVVLPLIRVGTLGLLCGDPTVTLAGDSEVARIVEADARTREEKAE